MTSFECLLIFKVLFIVDRYLTTGLNMADLPGKLLAKSIVCV